MLFTDVFPTSTRIRKTTVMRSRKEEIRDQMNRVRVARLTCALEGWKSSLLWLFVTVFSESDRDSSPAPATASSSFFFRPNIFTIVAFRHGIPHSSNASKQVLSRKPAAESSECQDQRHAMNSSQELMQNQYSKGRTALAHLQYASSSSSTRLSTRGISS